MGLRARLDILVPRRIKSLYRWGSNPAHPARSLLNVLIELNSYKFFVEKYEGKRYLGRPKNRCKDNIKLNNWIFHK
jgi:hypothetical protein